MRHTLFGIFTVNNGSESQYHSISTCVSLLAVTGQTEGLWVVVAGRSVELSAAHNVWTQAGLTGLSGGRVAIVTLLTPASATQVM